MIAADGFRRCPIQQRLGQREGLPRSAPFAMGKFALRGLSQSRPANSHRSAHIVVGGAIRNSGRSAPPDAPDSMHDQTPSLT